MAKETLTASSASAPPLEIARMSYEEFLQWDGNQNVEWVGGKVLPMSPVSKEHQGIVLFLINILSGFVETRKLGKVLFEPFQMKTGPDLPSRAPDIFFLTNPNLGRLKRVYLDGPADLVVEIISPGTRAVDRGEKFYEYEQGGVEEYWLIDPERKQAEFYQRASDGIYRLARVEEDGVYPSKVLPGLWLRVEWLWQDPLPEALSVLRELKVIHT